ncbi:phosphoglycerate mutase-like protein [Pleomassaria siparia CBS 279.74]|uniref:Phosphoglycerate mutase-like protein n=1 Tax=Pleomassaria siparia CBS 279.74 TaxID=1314801 RepID=A0A6G1JSH9_9PLEO|nr:phosphoglycerate mutase-like protein [Pleomassaria siparia CBS 279.74]
MIEVVYVIRHAFRTNWSVNPQTGEYTSASKTPTGIPTDPPLASYGVEQAKELAEYLCSVQPPIDRIYSSPFYRCLQTLLPTTERLFAEGRAGGKIRVDRGVGEFFGLAPFQHPEPPTLAVLNSHFPNLDPLHAATHIPHSRGEKILELHDRVEKALTTIITCLDSDAEKPRSVLICTHAATMIAIGRALTGNMPEDPDEDDFQCYTASLSRFERKKGDDAKVIGNWNCVLNSETSYLSGGAERGW